jgi:hypothetical protein
MDGKERDEGEIRPVGVEFTGDADRA